MHLLNNYMQDFWLFLSIGFNHITDLKGYDHILFLISISFMYPLKHWKKGAILITAFTIGHSITLFLNVFNIIFIPSYYVEILIPITIIFSIIKVVIDQLKPTIKTKNIDYFNYGLILFFGLIHGAGFSNYLKSILGKTAQIWTKLCAFNIGIELGQIIILSFFLLFTSIFVSLLKINIKYFIYFIAVCTIFLSIQMIIQRI